MRTQGAHQWAKRSLAEARRHAGASREASDLCERCHKEKATMLLGTISHPPSCARFCEACRELETGRLGHAMKELLVFLPWPSKAARKWLREVEETA